MTKFGKIASFLFCVLQFKYNSSQNANWPRDDSKPFPYPTPGPINVNTFRAKPIITPTPLTFTVSKQQKCYVENTGSALISTTFQPELATFSGGILYRDVYYFHQDEFLWDLKLALDVAVKVNGFGSPVQAVSTFYNIKYGSLENAMTKRDGIVQTVVFIYVLQRFVPNAKFEPFQKTVQSVMKAGTKKLALEYDSYDWFFTNSLRNDYYAYPGIYTDLKTGKKYNSSTVIVIPRFPPPILSFEQFNGTFGLLRNKNENRFSNKLTIYPAGPRPIVHGNGIILKFK